MERIFQISLRVKKENRIRETLRRQKKSTSSQLLLSVPSPACTHAQVAKSVDEGRSRGNAASREVEGASGREVAAPSGQLALLCGALQQGQGGMRSAQSAPGGRGLLAALLLSARKMAAPESRAGPAQDYVLRAQIRVLEFICRG